MLKWEIKNGDEKLKDEIKSTKDSFETWYKNCWSKSCTKEKMLSENSPVYHVYYKITKTFAEVKKKYPLKALKECSSCGKYVDKWLETSFSFCDEYGCGMSLCKDCLGELKELMDKM
ncbi:hypothetical protein [Clostridium sp.]|uniref:hypothetical protein n=1 Tax=Clostridium sp. TaxID=1506 RepID=UPI001A58E879|nr:hypothetical protein [Clostridium sp.]MBK5239862.1 hypothetical protein [Clostridium sp.]